MAAREHDARPRVSVVLACEGYPDRRVRGAPIEVDAARFAAEADLRLFEDGVRATPDGLETTGGRTFTVVAAGETVAEARDLAYRGVAGVRFAGMHCRRDIGAGRHRSDGRR